MMRAVFMVSFVLLVGCDAGVDGSPTMDGGESGLVTGGANLATGGVLSSSGGNRETGGNSNALSGGEMLTGGTRDAPRGGEHGGGLVARCDALAADLPKRLGALLSVRPAGPGLVEIGGETKTLRDVVASAESGDVIELRDGTYELPSAGPDEYTGLYFTTPGVTMRSESGNANDVVLDSGYGDHGGETAPVTIAAAGVVIAGLTVQSSVFHLVHLWEDADDARIHNVRLIDGGQQFLKGSPGSGNLNDVQVTCSSFVMTDAGRDNVWGYGPQGGGTRCYTGGIDAHGSGNWLIEGNRFEGIYCDADGPSRPTHGLKPELRGGGTYTGGLAEHAIHMWDSPQGTSHLIVGNHIIDCARGIGVGLREDVYGTQIRNNMIFSRHAASAEHDVGIIVERGHDIAIENNTIYLSASESYPSAVEYRWASSAGLSIRNNLTNRAIRSRDGATAMVDHNITDVSGAWLVDVDAGDLHLSTCDVATVVGAGAVLASVTVDIDGQSRGDSNDVGADQCSPL